MKSRNGSWWQLKPLLSTWVTVQRYRAEDWNFHYWTKNKGSSKGTIIAYMAIAYCPTVPSHSYISVNVLADFRKMKRKDWTYICIFKLNHSSYKALRRNFPKRSNPRSQTVMRSEKRTVVYLSELWTSRAWRLKLGYNTYISVSRLITSK